jgi:hypothetical protein
LDRRKLDGHRTDVGRKSNESWTDVRRKLDGRQTKVGRKLDGHPTKVERKLDGHRTKVGRTSDVERVELSRRCDDGGQRHYTATPRNAATMAESVAARSVVAALAGNALQLAAFFRHCCNNALDLATLLRWPTTRWTSQRCCDGQQCAGPRSVLLRYYKEMVYN